MVGIAQRAPSVGLEVRRELVQGKPIACKEPCRAPRLRRSTHRRPRCPAPFVKDMVIAAALIIGLLAYLAYAWIHRPGP
jgi:hypothetical protein